MLEQLPQFDGIPWLVIVGGLLALVAGLVCLVILIALLRRRSRRAEPPPVDLQIRLSELPTHGPLAEGPRLEFYGTPVRLAVLVLAPAGRNRQVPPLDQLPETIDNLVPGLAAVVSAHRPLIRFWPFQLSTQGFTHTFFNNVHLPGDRGKGTPWCAIAGRFEIGSQQLLAGLICIAEKSNSLSQVTVAHIGQWLDVLRVKNLGRED
jgi:hypothetical protein